MVKTSARFYTQCMFDATKCSFHTFVLLFYLNFFGRGVAKWFGLAKDPRRSECVCVNYVMF